QGPRQAGPRPRLASGRAPRDRREPERGQAPYAAEADARLEPNGRHADDAGRCDREGRAGAGGQRDGRLSDVQPADPDRDEGEDSQGQAAARPRLQARGLRRGDRQVMARPRKTTSANGNGYQPRLKERYEGELRGQLKDGLGVSSIMEVPRLQKITLNMGVGDATT